MSERSRDFLALMLLGLICRYSHAQQLQPIEIEALKDIKRQLRDETGSSFLSSWDFQGEPCSSFSGVVCTIIGQYSHVVMLNLGDGYAGSPGLIGTLSSRIGELTLLQQLTLVPGSVRGQLPESVGNLRSLQFLGISHNRISGCIPESFAQLSQLQVLDLESNEISCRIPIGLGLFPSLIAVQLSHNNLTGSIPAFVSSAMTRLDLSYNGLSGELPDGGFPASLNYLALKMNRLSGTIDAAVAPLKDLINLDLSSNDFSGTIPSSIFINNPKLEILLLQRNRFSGAVKVDDAAVPRMNRVDLSYNNLSGNIPPMLAFAESVYLNNNHFTGAVPTQFADGLLSANLRNLYLQHNFLTGFDLSPPDAALPNAALLCIQYNCLTPPSQSACPLNAGKLSSRPTAQCP